MRHGLLLNTAVAVAALAMSFVLDTPVAAAIHRLDWDRKIPGLVDQIRYLLKLPGFFPTTAVISIAVYRLHRLRWRAAMFLLLSSGPTALNEPVKFIAGRLRPFRATDGGWIDRPDSMAFHFFGYPISRMFRIPNLCFPSGHAALAFATATALSILFPRGRVWFVTGATIVGLERITENAHWCSDVAAGAILGIAGVGIVHRLCTRGNGLLVESNCHGS